MLENSCESNIVEVTVVDGCPKKHIIHLQKWKILLYACELWVHCIVHSRTLQCTILHIPIRAYKLEFETCINFCIEISNAFISLLPHM
jgi:hypothetical protein